MEEEGDGASAERATQRGRHREDDREALCPSFCTRADVRRRAGTAARRAGSGADGYNHRGVHTYTNAHTHTHTHRHRGETRGLGGIFFDDLKDRPADDIFEFCKDAGMAVPDAYLPIIRRHKDDPFTEEQVPSISSHTRTHARTHTHTPIPAISPPLSLYTCNNSGDVSVTHAHAHARLYIHAIIVLCVCECVCVVCVCACVCGGGEGEARLEP
jgi:hypothetical protein